jgi:hypothetical protein
MSINGSFARAGLALCMFLFAAPFARAADAPPDCHIGAYRLADGGLVDIGASEVNTLRWRRFDGAVGQLTKKADGSWTSTYGWTGRPDGKTVRFSDCATGRIDFNGVEGHRIAFDVTDTKFAGHGVTLVGRLVLPKGNAAVPIVVLVHGSEHDSALQFYALQRMLPAEGVGAFVYDKRGTGASGGAYSQDFSLLADDAVAAMRDALPGRARDAWVIRAEAKADGWRPSPPIARRLTSSSSASDSR